MLPHIDQVFNAGAFMNTKLLTAILQCSNELITSEGFLTKHCIGNAFTRSGKFFSTKV